MKYYKHLYLSEGLVKKRDKVIKKLEQKKFQLDIHLIVLSEDGRNQLEIYHSLLFCQPSYPERDYFVVGIAKGFDEAVELVEEITREVYNETRGADIRSYILKREQEE